jgi:hypothetical protein
VKGEIPGFQTKRSLKTRFGEHRLNNSIRLDHPDKSNIARHVLSKINDNQGHSISLNNLKLVKEVRKQNSMHMKAITSLIGRKKVLT